MLELDVSSIMDALYECGDFHHLRNTGILCGRDEFNCFLSRNVIIRGNHYNILISRTNDYILKFGIYTMTPSSYAYSLDDFDRDYDDGAIEKWDIDNYMATIYLDDEDEKGWGMSMNIDRSIFISVRDIVETLLRELEIRVMALGGDAENRSLATTPMAV